MATPAEKIMQFVEQELDKNPEVSNEELLKGAKKISRTVTQLSPRQFHAKYPLQVKRRKANGKTRPVKTAKARQVRPRQTRSVTVAPAKPVGDNEAVRRVLMRFAKDLAGADNQTQTIEVLANLDRYAGEIAKAAQN